MKLFINTTHRSFLGIVEPLQQLDRGAFTTAAATDQGNVLPTGDAQRQVLQNLQNDNKVSYEMPVKVIQCML